MDKSPERAVEKAVRGMLPKGVLGRQMITKLKIYVTPDHPHTAQQPRPLGSKASAASDAASAKANG